MDIAAAAEVQRLEGLFQGASSSMMSISRFAKACGVCVRTIERNVAAGRIAPAWRTPGGHMRFNLSQVEEFNRRPEVLTLSASEFVRQLVVKRRILSYSSKKKEAKRPLTLEEMLE